MLLLSLTLSNSVYLFIANLSSAVRRGLGDTSDIVRELEAAPPSKKLMSHRFKELKGSDFFLKNPIIEGLAPELREIFSRTMTIQTPAITAYQGLLKLSILFSYNSS